MKRRIFSSSYIFLICVCLFVCIVCRRGNSISNGSTRSPTTQRMKTTSSTTTTELPIKINDIEDLLQNVPTTTRRSKTTIASTTTPTIRTKSTTPAASDNNDLDFIRQVVSATKPNAIFAAIVCITHFSPLSEQLFAL